MSYRQKGLYLTQQTRLVKAACKAIFTQPRAPLWVRGTDDIRPERAKALRVNAFALTGLTQGVALGYGLLALQAVFYRTAIIKILLSGKVQSDSFVALYL